VEAAVDHVGHDALMDVVGVLWVVPNVGISRIMYSQGDASNGTGHPLLAR
jgi:hypothetical protein